MNAALYLGKNIGKINYKHWGTFKMFGNYSMRNMENNIEQLFSEITSINEMNYSIEKYKNHRYFHTHLLFNTSDETLLNEEINRFIKPIKIENGANKKLIKISKDGNILTSDINFKDVYISTNYTNYIGRNKEFFLEKVAQGYNSSIYIHKHCSYGLNNGYFKR